MSSRVRVDEKTTPKEENIRSGLRSRPTRSPARKKSPGRPVKSGGKRSGSKSPSRKSEMITTPTKRRSPARGTPNKKSPSRIPLKETYKKEEELLKRGESLKESFKEPSITKITTSTPILDIDTDSDVETKIPKPSTQIRGRTRTNIRKETTSVKSVLSNFDLDGLTMRITRSMTPKEIDKEKDKGSDKIVHLKDDFFTKRETKLIEYSDEDDLPIKKRIDLIEPIFKSNLKFRIEYCGIWGTIFLILFLPLFTITIAQCTITKSYPNFTKTSFYYDLYSYLGFFAFVLINFVISMIPFGQKPEGQLKIFPSSNYHANGIINFVINFTVIFVLEFYEFSIFDYINQHYLQLTSIGLIFGSLLSFLLFIKAHYVPVSALNVMGDTDSVVYNFFIGKEIAPVLFGVHMKIYLMRLVYIGRSILTTSILLKSNDINKLINLYPNFNLTDITSLNLNYSFLAVCFMTYIVVFDRIFYEKIMASSFEIRHEGHGYLTNIYFISSLFLYGLIPKYVYDARLQLNLYVLGLVCLVFYFGYIINRGSMNQKYWFRVNPFHTKVSHLSSLPTSQGKKLLCGGFWGIVRHPNYFGEILMNLSFAPFTCGSGLLLYVLCTIPTLIYRATRVEYRMRQRYEIGWERYCQNVRKMLIPKVF